MGLPRVVAGLDAGQLVGVLARATQIGSGLVTMLLVGSLMDARLQGYFYTFSSLIALQVLGEAGLGTVLLLFVAREMAHVRWHGPVLAGPQAALLRLRSITRFAMAWFGCGAVALVGVLGVVGHVFFGQTGTTTPPPPGILGHWLLLVLGTGMGLFTTALCNLVEGSGKVAEVAAVRLVQQLAGAVAAWAAIVSGAGLAALAGQALVVAAIGLVYIYTKRAAWRALCGLPVQAGTLNWRGEVLPFQWRIAVSWLCGYFLFQAFTPAVFAWVGPEAAGRMGMSLQLFSALSSVSIILVTARSAAFGRLASSGDGLAFDRLFRVSVIQSLLLLALMLGLLAAALWAAGRLELAIAGRILPAPELALVAAAMVGNHLVTAQATYLRAHLQEPFMRLSILNAVLMMAVSAWSIPHHGTSGATWTYAAVTLLISLPLATVIFRRFQTEKAAHAAAA